MAGTGRIGSGAARLGNIILGRGGVGSGTTTSLTAVAGSITFTGGTATIGPTLSAVAGSIVFAGGTATLTIREAATAGSITFTGGNAVLGGSSTLGAVAGAITFSGGTATLSERLAATTGALTLAGGSATIGLVTSALGPMLPDLQVVITFGANKRILNGNGKHSVCDQIRWSSIMPGGHHTFSCRISDLERSGSPPAYRYGATVTLRQAPATGGLAESGQILWQGYMVTPIPNDDGTCDIVGKGWHQLLAERDDALLWQDRYYGDWQAADSDGFTLRNNSDTIDAAVNTGSLTFGVKKATDVDAQDRAKLVWYYANATNSQVLPRRFAATVYKNRSISNSAPQYSLALTRYDSPTANSSRAIVQDHVAALVNNNSGDTGTDIIDVIAQGTPHPVIGLEFTRETPTPEAEWSFRITIRDVRVNDLASGDSYRSSQVVTDLADKVNFTAGSKVDNSIDNILPLFWQEGAWWDLIQYLAVAENVKWGVWENNPNPELEFRAWGVGGTDWTVNAYTSDATAIAHLAPDDEVYSVVDVAYTKGNSSRVRHVRSQVSPDPFAGLNPQRIRTFRVELQDPQPNEDLATVIANRLAADFGSEEYAGTVAGSFFTTGTTPTTAYSVRAGDRLTVLDFPGGPRTVRVTGVDHSDDGPSVLTIGRVPSRLDRILWWADLKKRRKGIR